MALLIACRPDGLHELVLEQLTGPRKVLAVAAKVPGMRTCFMGVVVDMEGSGWRMHAAAMVKGIAWKAFRFDIRAGCLHPAVNMVLIDCCPSPSGNAALAYLLLK